MPEPKMKIAWFEDDESVIQEGAPKFFAAGIEVIAILRTVQEAIQFVESPECALLSAVVIDGNLIDENTGKVGSDGEHAFRISRRMREQRRSVATIGYSGASLSDLELSYDVGKAAGFNVLVKYLLQIQR